MQNTPKFDPEALRQRLIGRTASVGVIGLGYVGLPLVDAIAGAGFTVIGFDVDQVKVDRLNAGQSYIHHIPAATIASLVAGGRFEATSDFARLRQVDIMLICVPTPLTRHREPDLSFVEQTTKAIAPHLREGHIVVLESTTYPGTTTGVMAPILEAGGLISGRDFFLAYSPEREDPGNAEFQTKRIPKIVGGDGETALDLAQAFYDQFVVSTVRVSSTATAEAVKLTENIFRAVNIALVNELKIVYEAMGIDIWEVIDAAKTKPFGFMPFYPGPGLGGHCVPIDPFYLTWKAREHDISTRFIELAGEINTGMPRHVVARVADALDRHQGRGLNGARIVLVGLAYKKNVDDVRESPSLKLIELLEARGATVLYYDPYIPEILPSREHAALSGRMSIEWSAAGLSNFDAALIATDHDGVDYSLLVEACPLVIDTRNACARAGLVAAKIVKA